MVSRLRQEWPITVVLSLVLLGLGVVASHHFRRGAIVIAFAITLAVFLRLMLSNQDAGLLAVRTKRVDLLVLIVLAVATTVLSLWVPPPSN